MVDGAPQVVALAVEPDKDLVEFTINVEEARAVGFEAEMAALINGNLSVTAGLGYVDTEIKSDDVARLSGNLFVNLKGEPLPRAPELSWSMAADYSFRLDRWDGWCARLTGASAAGESPAGRKG